MVQKSLDQSECRILQTKYFTSELSSKVGLIHVAKDPSGMLKLIGNNEWTVSVSQKLT